MRIVMLSDLESEGGAAIAAGRLAAGLIEGGCEVVRIVAAGSGTQHSWKTVSLDIPLSLADRGISKVLGREWRNRRMQERAAEALDSLLTALKPDVISIHNLHGSLPRWNLDLVEICDRHAPSAWTLHDMWSFTGRCAYAYDCRAFIDGCDEKCPTPGEYPELDPHLISAAWLTRQQILKRCSKTVAVCPSRWLAAEALQGHWGGKRVEVIPNGLPLDIFKPLDRNHARKELGIPDADPVLLMSAQSLSERRKGAHLLLPALREMRRKPLTLVTIGSESDFPEIAGVKYHHRGQIDREREVALANCAADLLIHPAPVDNLPNVILESIACGTPVVAFRTGGVPEAVRPGSTGWLASEVTPASLAATLDTAIHELGEAVDLRPSCRATAESEYSIQRQSARYINLFEHLS